MKSGVNRWDGLAIVGLGIWLILYLKGAATTFQPADSAEFLTVAATGGVAHPPGYPLYVCLGWLATKLFSGSVPLALAYLAAILTYGTLVGVYMTLRACRVAVWPAWLAAMLAGSSLHLWKHATHPEAFALLGCFAAWLCYAARRASDSGLSVGVRTRAWYLYALLAGLASAHHHTIVLTFPVGVVLLASLFRADVLAANTRAKVFGVGVLWFVLGLVPYTHLAIVGGHVPFGSWGKLTSIGDVFAHILRLEYGTFESGVYKAERPFWFHSWGYVTRTFSWKGSWLFGVGWLSLLGVWRGLFHRIHEGEEVGRFGWFGVGLLASWCLAGLLFPIMLQMGTSPMDRYVAARFFLLPDVFCALFVGLALAWLWDVSRGGSRVVLVVVCVLCWGVSVPRQWKHASSSHRNWLETYARDMLRELPKGAVLLEASDESICFGVVYLQEIKKFRRDVRFVCLPMLERSWYVERLKKRWQGFSYRAPRGRISTLSVIWHFAQRGRAVHATTLYNRSMQRAFRWLPVGLSWRMVPRGMKMPAPVETEARLHRVYKTYRAQRPLPTMEMAPWPETTLRRYGYPWMALGSLYHRMGRKKDALRCRKQAAKWIR